MSGPATIAILMPGDMGAAVGAALRRHGHEVVTCLAGRSARTRALAERAGLRDLGSLEAVVGAAEMVLSILPPAAALAQAEAVARAMRAAGRTPVYVDCNAISPMTMRRVAEAVAAAGAPVIDCGIIGRAPTETRQPRFHVSGPDTAPMEALDGHGIRVIPLGPEIGRASALKMVYAGLTKGTWTLHTALLMAAEAMGLLDEALAEYADSQPQALALMRQRVPELPADAGRWVGEMEEIAATMRAAGVPAGFHEAAAEVFRILAETPFAAETRETLDRSRTLEQAIPVYLEAARRRPGGEG